MALKAVSALLKRKMIADTGKAYSVMESKYLFPIYTVFHPSDGFEQFRWRKDLPSVIMCCIFAVLLFFVKSVRFFYDGFIFNENRSMDYNFGIMILSTIGRYCIFVAGNWAVSSLTDGKGTLKQIASVSAYSLIPFLLSNVIQLILTRFMTVEESALISIISAVGIIWTGIIIFIGLMQIHQYSTGKTVLSIIFTVIAMLIIALLIVLMYTLICQTVNFIMIIFSEIKLRW